MRNRGYVYTLVVMTLILIIISLMSYYIVVTQPASDDILNRMRTDELHYFVESIKSDYARSVSITSQRSLVYLIDQSIKNNITFGGFTMGSNCTNITTVDYENNGSQAAMAEMILCGTLDDRPVEGGFMENHTLLDWNNRINARGAELNFLVNSTVRSLEVIPCDPWSFYVISKMDLTVYDLLNHSYYKGYDLPVISIIRIEYLEDPLYATRTGRHDLIRYFTPCNSSNATSTAVNATTVEAWIDSECYLKGVASTAPSFFDRLDGSLNADSKYIQQSMRVGEFGLTQQPIGLESFIDVDGLLLHNLSADYNASWVDYYYWKHIPAYCSPMGLLSHRNFKIDSDHALAYRMQNLNCSILIGGSFIPYVLSVPLNTTVTWIQTNPIDSCILTVNARGWEPKELMPEEQLSWPFNETGTYTMNCQLTIAGTSFQGTLYVI
jgi:hypothetical protein